MISVSVIRNTTDFHTIKDAWHALFTKSSKQCPFLQWDWFYTWWNIYRTDSDSLSIILFYRDKQLIGIAPLYIKKIGRFVSRRVLRFLGTGENEEDEVKTEYLDVIIEQGNETEVMTTFFQYINNRNKYDIFEIDCCLETSHIRQHLINTLQPDILRFEQTINGYRYYLNLNHTWDEYVSRFKSAVRRKIKIRRNKFEEVGGKFIVSDVTSNDCPGLDALIPLHTLRWSGKGKAGVFHSKKFISFHERIIDTLKNRNAIKFFFLMLNNQYIAALYCYAEQGKIYFYQSGVDTDGYGSLSPGFILHTYAIEYAYNNKYEMYDFMNDGPNSYKSEFNPGIETMYDIRVYSKSIRSRIFSLLTKFSRIVSSKK